MAHFLLFIRNCLISTSYENVSLTVNLTLFYTVDVLLTLLGFARTILQATSFIYEKAEASKKIATLKPPNARRNDQLFLNRCL